MKTKNETNTLEIKNLHVEIEEKEILSGIDITIRTNEIHALMGPNGAGKSTLAYVIAGHPKYKITKGDILLNGESIIDLEPDERARKGIFLSFQYPLEIQGITMLNFLRTAYSRTVLNKDNELEDVEKFSKYLNKKIKLLGFSDEFINRYLNVGFSGGEKKRSEIFQMLVLKPKIAILDETDSGLDIDALKLVAKAVNSEKANLGILIITHYNRILEHIKPTHVHILVNGKIAKSGSHELVHQLEAKGYKALLENST
ncbi:MAG: Fe-S cluster assembly ATPase SufC [Candidatus Micrarchaeota archaeon]|nr:Fe-S cluster assembly ATPase SufC [Candidatus Micrarchaeota archaeon]